MTWRLAIFIFCYAQVFRLMASIPDDAEEQARREDEQYFLQQLTEAMAEAQLEPKVMAQSLKLNPSTLYRMLSGEYPLPLMRMYLYLPAEFWDAWTPRLVRAVIRKRLRAFKRQYSLVR